MKQLSNHVTKQLPKFNGKWVAISSNGKEIVGYGKHPKDAIKMAVKKGIFSPYLIQGSDNYGYFVG